MAPGSGRTCDACGRVISSTDIEHEINLAEGETFVFHWDCHLESAVGA